MRWHETMAVFPCSLMYQTRDTYSLLSVRLPRAGYNEHAHGLFSPMPSTIGFSGSDASCTALIYLMIYLHGAIVHKSGSTHTKRPLATTEKRRTHSCSITAGTTPPPPPPPPPVLSSRPPAPCSSAAWVYYYFTRARLHTDPTQRHKTITQALDPENKLTVLWNRWSVACERHRTHRLIRSPAPSHETRNDNTHEQGPRIRSARPGWCAYATLRTSRIPVSRDPARPHLHDTSYARHCRAAALPCCPSALCRAKTRRKKQA